MDAAKATELLDALEEAIGSGALTVTYAGKTVTYRSLDEMTRIAGFLARKIGRKGANPRVATMTYKNRRYSD